MTERARVQPAVSALVGAGLAGVAGVAAGLALPGPAVLAGAATAVVGGFAGAAAAAVANRRARGRRLVLPPAPTGDDLLAAVDQVEAQVRGKVPPAVSARVGRVCATVRDTVPRLDQLGPGSAQAHSVVATATSYLPEAVGSYLRLPRSWADRRPVAGGKTSLMVLCDQLDLLAQRMDQVFDAVCRADADALVAHGAFLREKFGTGSLDAGAGAGSRGVGSGG